jgi:hypothetical protein
VTDPSMGVAIETQTHSVGKLLADGMPVNPALDVLIVPLAARVERVTEGHLLSCIKALGEDFIKTISGSGDRFIATITAQAGQLPTPTHPAASPIAASRLLPNCATVVECCP